MFRGLLLATALILGAQAKAEPKSKQYPIETEESRQDFSGYQPKNHLSYRPEVHPGYPTNPYQTYGYDYKSYDYINVCQIQHWVDYYGYDMLSHRRTTRTMEICQNYCANLDGCNYWTWKNEPNLSDRWCLPKTAKTDLRHVTYPAISGNKACGTTFRD